MTTQSFDPGAFKSRQRQVWDGAAAAWERWGTLIEEGSRQVSERMIELAGIEPGQRVLDIASGTGEPALTVAQRVGPSGHVTATDQAGNMLAITRARASALGLQNLETREVDAEALDFPEASYDAALCRFGLMFLPDLSTTLKRVRGVLRPGGKFAAAIWDVPSKVPMLGLPMGIGSQMFEMPSPPPGSPTLFTLAPPGVLEQAFTAAGFTDVRAEQASADMEFPSGEAYVDFVLATAPPVAAVVSRQPPERQQAFRSALAEAARQYATDDGRIRMPNAAICVAGQRSA